MYRVIRNLSITLARDNWTRVDSRTRIAVDGISDVTLIDRLAEALPSRGNASCTASLKRPSGCIRDAANMLAGRQRVVLSLVRRFGGYALRNKAVKE